MTKEQRRIYVICDSVSKKETMKLLLSNLDYSIEFFTDAHGLNETMQIVPPNMIIIDTEKAGEVGIKICKTIRPHSVIPVIVLTEDNDIDSKIMALLSGCDEYLIKPFSPMELIARVQNLFCRMRAYEQNAGHMLKHVANMEFGDIVIDTVKREVKVCDKNFDVTPNEYSFLLYMIKNNDRAISRQELLLKVWNIDITVGVRATDDLVKRMRKKLSNAGSIVQIETVWGFGFRLAVTEQ